MRSDRAQCRVCILLASYNGMRFFPEQLETILSQRGVSIVVYVSDDDSLDGTREFVAKMSVRHSNIVLLSRLPNSGSAGQNFLRLSRDVQVTDFDYVAFADQDDIWLPNKLVDSIAELEGTGADAYSGDVVAFWPDGRRKKIVKSQPQRALDHFFEAAGPGCTYIAKADCFAAFQAFLNEAETAVAQVQRHDWLIYAWARAAGYKWHISKNVRLLYRQHDDNEAGANAGLKSVLNRLVSLKDGWYIRQVRLIANALATRYSEAVPGYIAELNSMALFRRVFSLRRRRFEAWLVASWITINRGR